MVRLTGDLTVSVIGERSGATAAAGEQLGGASAGGAFGRGADAVLGGGAPMSNAPRPRPRSAGVSAMSDAARAAGVAATLDVAAQVEVDSNV